MYARGGPSSVDKDKSLRALLDRSPADVRGIKLQQERAAAGDAPLTARPSTSPGEASVQAVRAKASACACLSLQPRFKARDKPPRDARLAQAVIELSLCQHSCTPFCPSLCAMPAE